MNNAENAGNYDYFIEWCLGFGCDSILGLFYASIYFAMKVFKSLTVLQEFISRAKGLF